MMMEAHIASGTGGLIKLFATFSEHDAGIPSWLRADLDFDPSVHSPTVGLRNDFNLLTTCPDMGGASSSMPRHSCIASLDLDLNQPPTQHSTYNPYNTGRVGSSSQYL